MKSYKKIFIILLCVSFVLIAVSAIVLFAVQPEGTVADLIFFILIIGIALLIGDCIIFAVKKQQTNRSGAVINAFINLGGGIYVQGECGSKNRDKKNATKNATSFATALFFAATLGTGVYALSDSRSKMEFIISENEMYGCEMKQSATVGYEYKTIDELKTVFKPVYKGWFAKHTIAQKNGKIILTGADGQCYISLDLSSCNAGKERLLNALENVFGVPHNGASQVVKDNSPSPFEEL